jgi:hypothetical protein
MKLLNKLLGKSDDGGETAAFRDLLDASIEGLRLQTGAHQGTWHFGEEERWDFAQADGVLVFTLPEMVARAPAQIIGTLDSQAGTWIWSWANATIAAPLTRVARKVREYGAQHRIRRLTNAIWPAEEMDCWRMAALANRLCSSQGVYRGPDGPAFVFFTFGQVELSRRGHDAQREASR